MVFSGDTIEKLFPLPPGNLLLVHVRIPALQIHQFITAAVFDDSATLQHQDPVGHFDSGEIVADD